MKCPYCGKETYEKLNYCEKCGREIYHCTKCNTPILFKTNSCMKCGEPIEPSKVIDLPEPDKELLEQEEINRKKADEKKQKEELYKKQQEEIRKKQKKEEKKKKNKKLKVVAGMVSATIVLSIFIGSLGGDDSSSLQGTNLEGETVQANNIKSNMSTQASTTQAPTTQAPTTQAPTTQAETRREDKYKIVNGDYDWESAQEECERMGGYLVWINDYEEWKYLTETFIPSQKNAGAKFLVGGRRFGTSHSYYWVKGITPFGDILNSQDSWINKHDLWFHSAIQQQPSFYDSETKEEESYLQIFYIKDTSDNKKKKRKIGWSFNDISISEEMPFICEFE